MKSLFRLDQLLDEVLHILPGVLLLSCLELFVAPPEKRF